ncbi:MAG: hypothetical protein A2W23_00595 [Planctomycetes bacterium RBG_16_43_13]|nr:MAG: hypothetical protein A2W23_00595 [Planctomycetes bacterium RBG_16_43_13]
MSSKKLLSVVVTVVILLSLTLITAQERTDITYNVDATKPEDKTITVIMSINNLPDEDITISMPAWSPGSYHIENLAKNVKNVTASKNNKPLEITQLDNQSWLIKKGKGNGSVIIFYEITKEKDDFNEEHLELMGPSTYMYIVGYKDSPAAVFFKVPDGWEIATGLSSVGDGYIARDYDTLIDSPAELGKFKKYEFTIGSTKYEVVEHIAEKVKTEKFDNDTLLENVRKIAKYQTDLFGGAPFDRYVFLFHFTEGRRGWGLEHLNSTSIHFGMEGIKSELKYFSDIVAHEFFHAWNVKRIRPRVLGPFDYTKEIRTNALWLSEGVTSYYGDLTLVRTGIWQEEDFIHSLSRSIDALQYNPDRLVTSAEKSSWTAWDKKEGPSISYYTKGELLGMLTDLRIRGLTNNKRTFDDVMQFLYRWFVLGGGGSIGVGFEEGDIERAISSISGISFKDFFQKYVAGTVELPYDEILPYAGYKLSREKVMIPDFGEYSGTTIYTIPKGSPAEAAGFKEGDRISDVNGKKVTRVNYNELFKSLKEGEEVIVRVSRKKDGGDWNREDIDVKFKVVLKEKLEYSIKTIDNPSEEQLKIRNSWLGK